MDDKKFRESLKSKIIELLQRGNFQSEMHSSVHPSGNKFEQSINSFEAKLSTYELASRTEELVSLYIALFPDERETWEEVRSNMNYLIKSSNKYLIGREAAHLIAIFPAVERKNVPKKYLDIANDFFSGKWVE